jgi:hypothetical protein
MKKPIALALVLLLIAVIAWATTVSDNFAGGDGGLGANWTTVTGYQAPQVSSGEVRANALEVSAAAYYNALTPTNAQFTQWTATAIGASDSYQWGLLRQDTGADTAYQCVLIDTTADGQNYEIFIVEAGVQTSLGADTASFTAGDVFYCEITTTVVTLKKNGASVLVGSPEATLASGRVGFAIFTLSNLADNQIDTWSGGDLTAAATVRHRPIEIQ